MKTLGNMVNGDSPFSRVGAWLGDVMTGEGRWFWPVVLFLHLFLRLATFYTPILDVDESQFAGFAHALMDGGLPYVASVDTKPLGIYLFYEFIFTVFGRTNMAAVHGATAVLWFASSYILSALFKEFGLRVVGRYAALFLVIFSTTFIPKYLATSINSVMVFFLTGSAYFVALSLVRDKTRYALLAGLVLGMAFLFKYTAGIQVLLFPAVGIFDLCRGRHIGRPLRWYFMAMFFHILAFLIPFALHGLYLYHLGVWPDFVQWSLKGSGAYIAYGGETIVFWQSFLIRFGSYVAATLFLWIYAGRTITDFFTGGFKTRPYVLFIVWFLLSLVPVCIGGRFYPHYFLHLLPALCGLAAIGIQNSKFKIQDFSLPRSVVIFIIVLPTLAFWLLRADHRLFLTYFTDNQIYEQEAVGKRLKEIAKPGDKVFVWGFATAIYFHSELTAASRFLWTDLLTGRTPGPMYARRNAGVVAQYDNPLAWQAFWQDMQKNRPTYFVDTSPADIHHYGRFPPTAYPKLAEFLAQNYDKIETIEGVEIYKRR